MDDFGGRLRQARERRGISLRQIAASTKISAAALEALERNDISKLPGGLFSRAFIRSYAIEVGLDPDDTIREFLARFDQEPAPAAAASEAEIPEEERKFHEQQRRAARALIAVAVVLVVIVVAGATTYRIRARAKAQQQSAPDRDAASAMPQQPTSATPPPPGVPSPPATAAVPAMTGGVATKPGDPAARVVLGIQPTADCWLSVTVDGSKIFARVVPAGETRTITVTEEATVEIGDAGAFAYTIDGKPGRPLGGRGQVRTLKLTPATAAEFIR